MSYVVTPGCGCSVGVLRDPITGRAPNHDLVERLTAYEREVTQLRVENDQLRRSAQAFGELAERLNRALLIRRSGSREQDGPVTRDERALVESKL